MLLCRNKYWMRFLLRPLITVGFIASFSTIASAQIYDPGIVIKKQQLNPLLRVAFIKPGKATPFLVEYIKPKKHELMYWLNYPLTGPQVEARNKEWERRNSKTIGGKIVSDIADDIIKTQVNSLIYGKKPVAVIPKF